MQNPLQGECRGTELNRRHGDFQSPALPTELPRQDRKSCILLRLSGARKAAPTGLLGHLAANS